MISYQIDAKQVLKKFKDIKEKNPQKIQDGIIKAGFLVEAKVKESISGRNAEPRSVDSGRFMQSVTAETKGLFTVEVGTNVSYAKYLEEGTRYIDAREHFANTRAREQKNVKDILTKSIQESIN